jgi:glutaminase
VADHNDDLNKLVGSMRALASPFRGFLQDLHTRYRPLQEGAVASYIPELAKADPDAFGISVVTVDGQVFEVGDFESLFTIQSISKPFVYGMALEDHGREHTLAKVGVEPTGDAFNFIRLDERSKRPTAHGQRRRDRHGDLIQGADPTARLQRVLTAFATMLGEIYVDMGVFLSGAPRDTATAPSPTAAQLRHAGGPAH